MSGAQEIGRSKNSDAIAPTPQNTPLSNAPLTREALSRPTVGTIGEEDENAVDVAAALQGNPALAAMVQDKLSNLVGRSSGYVESLPDHIRRRVEGLKGVQVEHHKIEADFQKEILELEKKYAQRYKPLYERRAAIIQGKQEPTADEVKAGEAVDADEDDDEDDEQPESLADVKAPADGASGIPEFWLTALKNHIALSELITERDEEALRALVDVRMSYLADQAGFKLEFEFDAAKNDYFSNAILTKTYYYQDEVGFSGDLVYDHAEGCKIEWKEDKDLTHKIETKKQRNKNTNQTRTVKRSVPVESFFNFFNPPKPPKNGEVDDDEADLDELDERLELDYQIGEDLKDRIIPHAVDFFTGKALQYEDLDDLDDADFDDEDDEDDEDDDDDDQPRRSAQLGASAGSQMAGSQDPQECKQQ
ncbi:probable nucleosome assembly protein I [Sporisorium reilianum f. sp. reilianum]|uniref:Probable nucleosome assembly protein I n=1 Tax=Sporisorium reilianum f. sp. reilianum TaxID=72559 RepID=A0A2N8UBU2_9BASI|nr:probable nucleosome assembly protein I [Sporisorium reilianum f. sp. reilianum]